MTARPRKTPNTARPRPTNVVPIRVVSRPPPADLEPPEAELWGSIVGQFVIDTDAALELLGTAMRARARMRRCAEQIGRDGETVKDRWGVPRAHPLLVAERGARDSYLAAMRVLNLDTGGVR